MKKHINKPIMWKLDSAISKYYTSLEPRLKKGQRKVYMKYLKTGRVFDMYQPIYRILHEKLYEFRY